MSLTNWLKLQIFYALAGISFNLVSYFRIKLDLDVLTNTNPVLGIAIMSTVCFAVWAARKGYRKTFITINLVLTLLLTYAGVIKHLSIIDQLSWVSIFTSPLVLAVAINCFGVAVMMMGVIAILRTNQTK